MSDLPAASIDSMLDALLVPGTTYYLSLHTADPGTTGANEVTGGSYARQPITYGAAASGSKASSGSHASQAFPGMPSESGNLWTGVWTAATSGTFLWGDPTAGVTGPVAAGATVNFGSGQVTHTLT
jgi:hypothetical protein